MLEATLNNVFVMDEKTTAIPQQGGRRVRKQGLMMQQESQPRVLETAQERRKAAYRKYWNSHKETQNAKRRKTQSITFSTHFSYPQSVIAVVPKIAAQIFAIPVNKAKCLLHYAIARALPTPCSFL